MKPSKKELKLATDKETIQVFAKIGLNVVLLGVFTDLAIAEAFGRMYREKSGTEPIITPVGIAFPENRVAKMPKFD